MIDGIAARVLGLRHCGVFTEIEKWGDAVRCTENPWWRILFVSGGGGKTV